MPHWKHVAKQRVKPLVMPVLARLDRRTQAQLESAGLFAVNASSTQSSAADHGYTLNSFKELLPSLMGVIATQHAEARQSAREDVRRDAELARMRNEGAALRAAVDQEQKRAAVLEARLEELAAAAQRAGDVAQQAVDRVEFVRAETMLELKYGRAEVTQRTPIEGRIIDEQKVAAARENLRLNLGAGHVPRPGFINVDGRELPGIDVVADVMGLPFGPGEVSEIRSEHLLEHFPEERLRRELLPYWRSLLRSGGRLTAVVPDTTTMLRSHAAGEMPFDELRQVLFGGQEYEGDFHFTAFTEESLTELFRGAGFAQVVTVETGRRNGLCFEMELTARVDSD